LEARPAPVSLDEDALANLETAWAAVTAPTPERLADLVGPPVASVPLLHRSLASLLGRFPSKTSGLSHWDLEWLRHTAERGPEAARVIGYTIGYGMETHDLVDDGYLFSRLRALADTRHPRPLVALAGAGHLRDTRVELTDAGRAVLAGTPNALDANDIDDWVGGTHLDSRRGNVWAHEGRRLERRGGPG